MVRTNSLRAFTLIELLLVLVILAVLASIAIPTYFGYVNKSRRRATITEIASIKSALGRFEIENGRFPNTNEGLLAMVQVPSGLEGTWAGPYLEKVPEDKFGHDYMYISPGNDDPSSFDITSAGDDGTFGTQDDITKYTEF